MEVMGLRCPELASFCDFAGCGGPAQRSRGPRLVPARRSHQSCRAPDASAPKGPLRPRGDRDYMFATNSIHYWTDEPLDGAFGRAVLRIRRLTCVRVREVGRTSGDVDQKARAHR